MMAARYLGFGRLTAARFSLLLSLPTIAGAGVLKTHDLVQTGDLALGADALIVAALSCLFAFAAIDLMMRWLARADFTIFVGYRLALGIALLVAIQADYL
jgi:undecaprenyl-diphosphatase